MQPELARFITDLPIAMALFDTGARYVAASREWVAAFGLPRTPVSGRGHDTISKIAGKVLADIQQRVLAGEVIEASQLAEARLPQQSVLSARPHHAPDGTIAGIVVVLRSATAASLCGGVPTIDSLVGIADRRDFLARLRDVLAQPASASRAATVFAINLDNLRTITNLHGAEIADEIFRVTAERLIASTRSAIAGEESSGARQSDTVARLGPDQFAVLSGRTDLPQDEARRLAARFQRIVQNPVATRDQVLRLNASVGFVVVGAAHVTAEDILRDLDLTLQEAQMTGPSRVIAWEPALTASASRRYSLGEQLRRAFDNGEFALHYQPVMRLRDNRMVGVEALLRWNHPSEGLMAPAAFLPVLEESGLILDVGCWIVREAVRQVESWQMLYGRDLVEWVAVNLSHRQFIDPAPLLATLRSIHDGGFSVSRLKFEIAEPALTRSPEISRAALTELGRLGIRVAIDDFGTGHASLTSLRDYSVDTIKLDGAFVEQIGTPQGEKLVDALIDIAHGYGASVIAEGIETKAQRDFLWRGNCELGQGYLFAEPMDGARLGSFALVHTVGAGPFNPPTSAYPSPARSADAAHGARLAT